MTGKKVPAYKKESTNLIKIIGQLVFILSSVKSLISLYSILYLITLWKTNFLQSVINDLPDGIKLICKIFADYTLLFSKVKDNNYSTVELKMI